MDDLSVLYTHDSFFFCRGLNLINFYLKKYSKATSAKLTTCQLNNEVTCEPGSAALHYVNVSVLIKFSQKTSVFTLIIISSP